MRMSLKSFLNFLQYQVGKGLLSWFVEHGVVHYVWSIKN